MEERRARTTCCQKRKIKVKGGRPNEKGRGVRQLTEQRLETYITNGNLVGKLEKKLQNQAPAAGFTGWVGSELLELLELKSCYMILVKTQEYSFAYNGQVLFTVLQNFNILFEPKTVLCGSAGNKFFFSNENKLVTSWSPDSVNKICPSSTQTSSKEESKVLRQMLPTFLKPEALQMYIGMMDAIVQRNFEANWDGEQQVKVFPLAKRYTFWVACKGFLSIEEPDHVAKLASPFNALASAILSIPIDLPVYGSGITNGDCEIEKTRELLNCEDIQKMKYSWNVACEVMRLAPPLQGAFREAINDVTFAGFSIHKGWKNVNSTHGNPDCFSEPENFDPKRFEGSGPAPYTFVPFGGGPRTCPGKEDAHLETLVFMHHVIMRHKWEKLLPWEKIVWILCQC
ncbi:hypothetical protein SLEP1_g36033 [Rubroshorea leprosula]|uniref:Cytochrome P450 n=1 Tax=Rubroshorea leprosula TaxID=152421 RepID=A0AAV5KQQ1_9ROSI|nr:hypothetical protein SLEP1_g36033 [Rubroshorea leprosula]